MKQPHRSSHRVLPSEHSVIDVRRTVLRSFARDPRHLPAIQTCRSTTELRRLARACGRAQALAQDSLRAGVIAARFGPVVGGLFLAFPAIFPASATLIEKHVRRRKEKAGLSGVRRGREAAALDAAGAALGSLGLAAFAVVIWLLIERSPALALVLVTAAWLTVAVLAWAVRRWL